jgi:hypothetical protein
MKVTMSTEATRARIAPALTATESAISLFHDPHTAPDDQTRDHWDDYGGRKMAVDAGSPVDALGSGRPVPLIEKKLKMGAPGKMSPLP